MTETYLPVEQPQKQGDTTQLTSNLRATYAKALQDGTTLGPQDFHDAYHKVGFPEVPDLRTQLPSNQDLIDHSLEALRRSSMPISPETVHTTRANILDHWATTGNLPDLDHGPTADAMTREQSYLSPVHQNISGVIRQIESGGLKDPDAAVSSSGATGRYQIMPNTAKQYGFDPDKLHDAAYNTMVHNAIIDDLSKRYHGQTDAILIAYNAGPMWADKYIAEGRNPKILPDETQGYLKKADRLTYGDDLMKPARDAVYDPMGTLGAKEEGPVAVGGLDLGTIAKAAGIPDLETQHQRVLDRVKQMGEEGASKSEQLAYQATNDPYGNWFGVGSIGDVAGTWLYKLFHMPQEGKETAQALIREGSGQARAVQAAASTSLEEFRGAVNKKLPEFREWLQSQPWKTSGSFWQGAPDIMHLIDHMEGGAGGGQLSPTSPLKPVADAIRAVNGNMRKLIEQHDPDMNFVADYYTHMWTDPSAADRLMVGRQGSSASLKKRTVPTIADGIQGGLTPQILDPIENTLRYVSSMTNHLTGIAVRKEAQETGFMKYLSPGEAPGGWEALNGKSATIAHPGVPGQLLRAYAPGGFARSYNNWVGGGLYEHPWVGPIYAKLQQASNFMTGIKLGVPGFHAYNIATENIASAINNATGEMLNGEVLQGFRDLGWGVTMIGPSITKATRGTALQKAYLKLGSDVGLQPSTLDEQLMSYFTRAGGRAIGRGAEYGYNQATNWGQAWERGALKFELEHNLSDVLGKPGETTVEAMINSPGRLAGTVGHEVGRVMSTITAPLFDQYIPKLKVTAFAESLGTWLRANPKADDAAIMRQSRYLLDSVDDRFGEMVQDNLFWPRSLKQVLNLVTVSVGWEFGTLRAATRASKELLNGNFRGEYLRWAVSYAAAAGLMSSAYQYLISGAPQQSMIPGTYYTGGKGVGGEPELGLMPGIQKDVLQWYHLMQSAPSFAHVGSQVGQYAVGKLNPFASMVKGAVTNTDWKGDPIISNIRNPEEFGLPSHWSQLMGYIGDTFVPIGAEMIKQMKPGTEISGVERFMGIRPAPEWLMEPNRMEGITQHMERGEARKELRQQRRNR